MDIMPLIPKDKKIITKYSSEHFTVNDKNFVHSIIVTPDQVFPWHINNFDHIDIAEIMRLEKDFRSEIILVGCSSKQRSFTSPIKQYLLQRNIPLDLMTTDAACRTFNLLVAEGRNVLAALIKL